METKSITSVLQRYQIHFTDVNGTCDESETKQDENVSEKRGETGLTGLIAEKLFNLHLFQRLPSNSSAPSLILLGFRVW